MTPEQKIIIRSELSKILKVATSFIHTQISTDLDEWELTKRTTVKVKRKILDTAIRQNEINREKAIELNGIYKAIVEVLSESESNNG